MTTIELQQALLARGFYLGPKGPDGKLGPSTRKAVRAFQVSVGILADGKPGPHTKAALFPERLPQRTDDLPVHAPSTERPGAEPATRWPHQRECMAFYGGVGLNQATLTLPFPMRLAWDKHTEVSKIRLHTKVIESAGRAFESVASNYDGPARRKLGIDLFGGSLNVRAMRGGKSYSMHSWGIAIDFDPERNQLKWTRERARLAQADADKFWQAWTDEGWVSLGQARDMDWMHVQAARL